MLQTNPALLEQLRQRILSSGLTPEQVRARLRAEGYPENLLDAYLPGGAPVSDSSVNAEDVFAAVTQLGIADTTEVQLLRWCKRELPDAIKVSESILKAAVADHIRTTGEVVEGCELAGGAQRLYVK